MKTLAIEDPAAGIARSYSDGIRPEPVMSISAWADAYRMLPQKSSAEPGRWRTSRTPYMREIVDSMSATSDIEEIVAMMAAQLGKTEAILSVLGYVIDHAPGPAMIVQPTVELAKRFSRQRLEPMITGTPRLVGKVADANTRDAHSTMLSKEFMGGIVVLTGANSAVGLRSMPVRWLLLDEIDGYPADVDGEGGPVELAEARQRTFARRKRLKVSTPTIAGSSAIERAYLDTDQRRYFVPCPHCGGLQILEFKQLAWTKFDLPPERAVYVCSHCEKPIEEHHKTEMLAKGEWHPTNPDADPKARGYHLSGLYSPVGWMSWGDIAKKFVKVHKNPEEYRVFVNTILAETWKEKGEAPEWERLYERRENYKAGIVPARALFLTAGVDVQKDRVVVEIVAWGRGKESWSIDCGEVPGDTGDLTSNVWVQLDTFLARGFPHECGVDLQIRMLAIDSGFNTQTVYSWARKYPMSRVIAVKGQGRGGALIGSPSSVDINMRGKRPIYGYKVWPVCGAVAKSELYGFLRLNKPADGEPYPPGYCHSPEHDQDYFKQLTAEHLVPRKNARGYVTLDWEVIPGRENHVLDCRVYARAAASLCGMDRMQDSDWTALERVVGVKS